MGTERTPEFDRWSDILKKVAIGTGITSVIVTFLFGKTGGIVAVVIAQTLMLTAFVCMTAIFCLWAWAKLRRWWSFPAFRIIVSLVHLAFGVVAVIVARNTVSRALGLPAQDFDMAVTVMTLYFYLPIWGLVFGCTSGLIAICLFVVGAFDKAPSFHLPKHIWLAGGALGTMMVLALSFDTLGNFVPNAKLARWAAYVGDFQEAPNYPGIKPKERIRLHENGVISRAAVVNGEVDITMTKFVESSPDK